MSDFTLDQLSAAATTAEADVLLLRSGEQDYKLPISTLADHLLSDDAGAAKVGVAAIYGLGAENVQEAIQALYDRETSSPQALAPADSPDFVNVTLTGLGSANARMLVAGAGGAISAMDFSRPIFCQLGEVEVDTGEEQVVVPQGTGIGNLSIPSSKWAVGAGVELDFQFTLVNDGVYSPGLIYLTPTLGGDGMVTGSEGRFVVALPEDFTSFSGTGRCRIIHKAGATSSATLYTSVDVAAVEADPESGVAPLHAFRTFEIGAQNISTAKSVGLKVEFEGDSYGLVFTLKTARVIWHPAPQGLA